MRSLSHWYRIRCPQDPNGTEVVVTQAPPKHTASAKQSEKSAIQAQPLERAQPIQI